MISEMIEEAKQKMKLSIESFQGSMVGISTGIAHPGLVENITVEINNDGNKTTAKLKQLASVRVTNGNELRIELWDDSHTIGTQKAISDSQLGLNSRVDSKNGQRIIMVAVPKLSGDFRKKLAQEVQTLAEKAKIAVRGVRRGYHDVLSKVKNKKKDDKKDTSMSEDDAKRTMTALDKLTEQFIEEVDRISSAKQKDIVSS